MDPKPEAQVARLFFEMFRNWFFEIGKMQKVSPKVSLDQSIDEKVSPNNKDNDNNGDLLLGSFNLEKYFTVLKKVYRF